MNEVRIVLDTNIIISSLSLKSPYRAIIDHLVDGSYELYVTNEILLEYEELIRERYDKITADIFLDALTLLTNVHFIKTYYQLRLIFPDLDDNKFVDCAFASNAHILVTNDRDFNILKKVEFPKFTIMRLDPFLLYLEGK